VALHKDDARAVRYFVLWISVCIVGWALAIAGIWWLISPW
jgi:hypothetical protein